MGKKKLANLLNCSINFKTLKEGTFRDRLRPNGIHVD